VDEILTQQLSSEEIERVCFRNLMASSEERVFFKDLDSKFLMVSTGFVEQYTPGLALEDLFGKTDFDIFSAQHAVEAYEDEQRVVQTGEPMVTKVERETYHDRPDAFVSTTKLPLRDDQGRIIGTFGISRDVTAQVEAQDALAHQALHDSVTGLANRIALMDRLTQALVALERHPGRVALLFIDVDDFKTINDTFGHEVGDQVLTEVGRRLERVARHIDTVSRFGGDEFVLLCTALREDDDLRPIGDRIMREIRKPLNNGHELMITASIGAVSTTDPTADPGELVQQADFAMYAAKRSGRNRLETYDAELHGLVTSSRGLSVDLQRAIERSELFVLYQPLLQLEDRSLTGVEALVRWRHPERGIILPAEFIPLAEQSNLIGKIDAFVLDEACRQLAAWTDTDASWEGCTMAVNLSGRQLREPGLVDLVTTTLRRHNIAPSRLCLEITETAMIGEPDNANRVLRSLSALGVRIALDDFGTGYSTLAHLQRVRADILKIDRSFVANIGREARDREIIAAVTAMAHALGMTVVGEGVETNVQRDELTTVDCDEAQGYLFAAPMPPAEIAELWTATVPRARARETTGSGADA
jgi:diguanylate cyclase (GGDEF)-like protein/PAS domain S-box-containing protein